MHLAVPILVLGVTSLLCGAMLALAARFFAVQEDPRVEALSALLPGANCGTCGFPSCREYAREILGHGSPINLCKRDGDETQKKIASWMGVEARVEERQVALVRCQGDDSKACRQALYNGVADCSAAELAGGGGKACRFGCLGLGSCARACPLNAIEITSGNLALVHAELCIGCGKCVAACLRGIITLVPESRSIHVLCISKDRGPWVKKVCSVGCIACAICAKTVGNKGITMQGALAVVDYAVPLESEEVIAKCPRKTIVKRSGRKPAA